MNQIKFKKEEIKEYPLLEKIEIGLRIIAINSYYDGLYGTISDIKYGEDKETENEGILDIYVDFEEPENGTLEELYPQLNGTGIDMVIMGEEQLGFFFDDAPLSVSINGKAVCPNCYTEMDVINETQYDDIQWTFKDGEYVKENLAGDTNGKRCGNCDNLLPEDEEQFFMY